MKSTLHLVALLFLALSPVAAFAKPVAIPTKPANANYYPWITQLSQSPIDWFAKDTSAKIQGRAYRVVVLLTDIYNSVYFEQVTFGTEGCCKAIASVRQFDIKAFSAKFGFTGELTGFRFMRWLSPTSFIFRYQDRLFMMAAIDEPEVQVEPYSGD
jgi:hypothetical protein